MSEFILHHYALSPYAEKIRAMFGYTGQSWMSATVPAAPPRTYLKPLAGDYGRIPVAQIGADVFCDTALIVEELAALSGRPELGRGGCNDEQLAFTDRCEGDLFFAAVIAGSGRALKEKAKAQMSFFALLRLVFDRMQMRRKAKVEMVKPGEAKGMLLEHMNAIEAGLDNDFLYGDAPCLADFAAYHSLWFARDLGERSFFSDYPKIGLWMDRIKAYGHGEQRDIDPKHAWTIASEADPRAVASEHSGGDAVGKMVSIAPNDYRLDHVNGKLVGDAPGRWIIARENRRTGTVHVHFPKQGYELKVLG